MNYVLGIDAGGTKTQFTTYDKKGRALFDLHLSAGNIVVDTNRTLAVLRQGVQSVLEHQSGNCLGVLAGIAGIETSGLHHLVQHELQQFQNTKVISDARLGLVNKLEGSDGALIISGTGSVAYGSVGKTFYRVGGWGHLVGDEGSAYALALKCYRHIAQEMDHGSPLSRFSQDFLSFLGMNDPAKAISELYQMNKAEVAQKSLFFSKAHVSDPVTHQLLQEAADELVEMIRLLLNRMNQTQVKLALAGSVLEKNHFIRESVVARLQDQITEVVLSDSPNTKGAFYFYRKLLSST